METPKVTLLAIDDDPTSLELIAAALEQNDLRILTEDNPERGLEVVRRRRPEIVLVDLVMPQLSGLEVLDRILEIDPATDVILITAHYSTETAVQAIQQGATDYLNKPLDVDALRDRVETLLTEQRRRLRAQQLDSALLQALEFESMIGRSPAMLSVFDRIRRVAPHFRTVLISGPTGSGKELVARALHRLSPVANKSLVVCNCAAIPENLVESELFGHMQGAFTGATRDKPGFFERAHGGALFLDEIGELPPPAQAKLLRAVQQQEVQRIGSTVPRKVDVRIIAATNRELRESIEDKSFREDLFYRLSMIEIKLPSVAERREDLPLLERHFINHFSEQYDKPIDGLSRRAELVLARHHWPGNVRELENVLGNACMMCDSSRIDVADLPEYLREPERVNAASGLISLDEAQRLHARRVLDLVGGSKVEAAKVLGVSRATCYRLLADPASREDSKPD